MYQYPNRLRWAARWCSWPVVLLAGTVSAPTTAVAESTAGLEASAKLNAVIQFESAQLTSNVGHSYRGDLNENQQYREAFKLVLKRGEAAVFELVSKSFDAKLQIFSVDGQELASDDDSGDEPKSAKLVFAAPQDHAGTFYLVTSSVDNRGGSFVLTATPQIAPAAVSIVGIAPGTQITGRFDKRSALRVGEQEIVSSYSFDADPGGRVLVEGRSDSVPLRLELRQNDKVVAVGSTRSAGASLYFPATAGGRYHVDVIARSDSVGDFSLLVKKLPKQRTISALLLSIGSTADGVFGEDSPTISPASNRPYALFEINGAAGDKIALSATLENTTGSAGYDAPPITIAVGADTPAGFAEVSSAMSPPQIGKVRTIVTFLRPGPLLVRILARSGAVSKFTVNAERVVPASEPGASETTSD